jgi:transcriptional regulator with GAF, ATPase, and Fis domain
MARELQGADGPEATRDRVTALAVSSVHGCDHAGISLIGRHSRIDTVAATDEVPARVDAIQFEVGEGPGLDAIAEHAVFQADDLSTETRWPQFSYRAMLETGVRSMLAFRLFVQDDTIGALVFYSREVDAFNGHGRMIGSVLAAHAAVALNAAGDKHEAVNLERALDSNRRIGIAIGILMAQGKFTDVQAFALLRYSSQYLNIKLRVLAEQIIDRGELPATPPEDR